MLQIASNHIPYGENTDDNRKRLAGFRQRHAEFFPHIRLEHCPYVRIPVLCIAGLATDGFTIVDDIVYIQRGYERFEEKLQSIGGIIEQVEFYFTADLRQLRDRRLQVLWDHVQHCHIAPCSRRRFEEKLQSIGGIIEQVETERDIQKFKLKVG